MGDPGLLARGNEGDVQNTSFSAPLFFPPAHVFHDEKILTHDAQTPRQMMLAHPQFK